MTSGDSKPLDETGWKILYELQKDAKISYKKIAAKVNLSQTAIIERVKRMEEEGIITGYTAKINPMKLGYCLKAFITLSVNFCGNPDPTIKAKIDKMPEIVTCWPITGTYDYIIEAYLPSLELLDQLLLKISEFGNISTSIALSGTIKETAITQPRNQIV